MNDTESADQRIYDKIKLLESRYSKDNQQITDYLDGLLHSKYLNYWDYIRLETLLTLQQTQSNFNDEMIFIVFHQVTELYFKLVLQEIEFLAQDKEVSQQELTKKLRRMNKYLEYVSNSFDIVSEEMSQTEFAQFRTSLFPASGFQSIQYRKIEICATDLINLVVPEIKEAAPFDLSLEECLENIYWKNGATDKATGMQSITLKQFQDKYGDDLHYTAMKYKETNLWKVYLKATNALQIEQELLNEMRNFDVNFNIKFGLSHLKAVVKHLKNNPSTGGTNWQKYLPPKYQKTIFFPELWSREEILNWGRDFLVS